MAKRTRSKGICFDAGLTPFGARLVSAESARLSDLLGTAARLGLAGSGGA
jgi:hypothetical protein